MKTSFYSFSVAVHIPHLLLYLVLLHLFELLHRRHGAATRVSYRLLRLVVDVDVEVRVYHRVTAIHRLNRLMHLIGCEMTHRSITHLRLPKLRLIANLRHGIETIHLRLRPLLRGVHVKRKEVGLLNLLLRSSFRW